MDASMVYLVRGVLAPQPDEFRDQYARARARNAVVRLDDYRPARGSCRAPVHSVCKVIKWIPAAKSPMAEVGGRGAQHSHASPQVSVQDR